MLIEQAASGERGGRRSRPISTSRRCQSAAEFEHPVVATVDDIDVAGGIHRHTDGVIDAGERQHRWRVRPGGQLQHPIVVGINHIHTSGGVHCHIDDAVQIGEWQHRRGVRPRRQASVPGCGRSRPRTRCQTVSTAIPPMPLTCSNGSTVGAFDPTADFTTWTGTQHPPSEYTPPPLAPYDVARGIHRHEHRRARRGWAAAARSGVSDPAANFTSCSLPASPTHTAPAESATRPA